MAEQTEATPTASRSVRFIGSSRKEIRGLPKVVKRVFGQALFDAQTGQKHPDAKPLKGFGGAGVLEVASYDRGGTYRAAYTVRFADIVYVLHVFQKKSKSGIKTPPEELNLIRLRLRAAEKDYVEYLKRKTETTKRA